LSNFKYKIFNDTDGVARANASGTLKAKLEVVLLQFSIKKKRDAKDKEYDIEFYKGSISVCDLTKGFYGALCKNIWTEVKNMTNVELKCPVEPQDYYSFNIRLPIMPFLPPMAVGHQWKGSVIAKGKRLMSKRMVSIYNLDFFGHTSV
jgi:Protein of unknown function (DUF1091)